MPPPQKIKCTVTAIDHHGDDVFSVTLRPERPAPRFRPGQFLHLALDAWDPGGFWPESRVFSIASGPASRDQLRITYAVHGPFTARMAAELTTGRAVWVKMPYGDFVIDGEGEIVLCAGGTGITAFTAFLEQLGPGPDTRVTVAYAARRPELLIYRDVIEQWVARDGRITALYFAEAGELDAGGRTLPGRLSLDAVWPLLADPLAARYYLSGPPGMLRTIEGELRTRHVLPESIRTDAWE